MEAIVLLPAAALAAGMIGTALAVRASRRRARARALIRAANREREHYWYRVTGINGQPVPGAPADPPALPERGTISAAAMRQALASSDLARQRQAAARARVLATAPDSTPSEPDPWLATLLAQASSDPGPAYYADPSPPTWSGGGGDDGGAGASASWSDSSSSSSCDTSSSSDSSSGSDCSSSSDSSCSSCD